MPIMPEPQMQPFDKFDKNSYVLQRKEKDWWPKINKAVNPRQCTLSEKKIYYCPNMVCLTRSRPLLSKENITIIYCGEGSIADIKEDFLNFH